MCLAIPGQIVELLAERDHLALVDVAGVRRKIDVGLLAHEPAQPGDWVLIHVGFALNKISEQDALEQMQVIATLGETDTVVEEIEGDGVGSDASPEARE